MAETQAQSYDAELRLVLNLSRSDGPLRLLALLERVHATPGLLGVDEYTNLLATVDAWGWQLVGKVQDGGGREAERKLVGLAGWAQLLRRQRQEALALALDRLDRAALDPREFVRTAVAPLLRQPWLPATRYEAAAISDAEKQDRQAPLLRGRVGELVALSSAREDELVAALADSTAEEGLAPLGDLLTVLRGGNEALAGATAAYLEAAARVRAAWAGRRVWAPVLLAPLASVSGAPSWPLGQILDLLVVPALSAATADGAPVSAALFDASFRPAWAAVQQGRAADELGSNPAQWQVFSGDYPGGAVAPGPSAGPSAGLALAVGLSAFMLDAEWRDDAFATAQWSSYTLQPLSKGALQDAELYCKGYTVGLWAQRNPDAPTRPLIVTGGAADSAALQSGLEAAGLTASVALVRPVSSLADACNLLLTPLYRDHVNAWAAAGAAALSYLERLASAEQDNAATSL